MAGEAKEAVPWSKDIVVRLYQCLQRYPFQADVRDRAVEHVRKKCLQLITADDFKQLGKELGDIIHPVKLAQVLQATCNMPGPPAASATDPGAAANPHKRSRNGTEVDASGKATANCSGHCGASTVIRPEAVRLGMPGSLLDPRSATRAGNDIVPVLIHLVQCVNLAPEQLATLIQALESYQQGRQLGAAVMHTADGSGGGGEQSISVGFDEGPRSVCDGGVNSAAAAGEQAAAAEGGMKPPKGPGTPYHPSMDAVVHDFAYSAALAAGHELNASELFASPTHWATPLRAGQPAFNSALDALSAQAASLSAARGLPLTASANPSLPNGFCALASNPSLSNIPALRWWPAWSQGVRNYLPPPTTNPIAPPPPNLPANHPT